MLPIARICVALQPLEIGAQLRRILVPDVQRGTSRERRTGYGSASREPSVANLARSWTRREYYLKGARSTHDVQRGRNHHRRSRRPSRSRARRSSEKHGWGEGWCSQRRTFETPSILLRLRHLRCLSGKHLLVLVSIVGHIQITWERWNDWTWHSRFCPAGMLLLDLK